MPDEQLVLVERHEVEDGRTRGELVLNRPERRNALIGPLVDQLHAGLDELSADDAVRAILVRGAGGFFCAGMDLRARREDPPPDWVAGFQDTWADFHAAMFECPKLTIGVLEGAAIAGGTGLALSCDVLIAADDVRFHVAEVGLGMLAPMNAVWLEYKYGVAKAIEFVVGGQPYDGPALVAAGLALTSVPGDRVLDEARGYADAVSGNDVAAMAGSKSMIRSLSDVGDFRERLRVAQQHGRR
jgi:enoyl-CoA hydratase/carnithine racemase